jgi:hypothetical protein
MAELTAAETAAAEPAASDCCAPAAQATCCEPSEKAACCETGAAGGTCGCAAGQSAVAADADALRETVRERYAAAAMATTDPIAAAGCCDPGAAVITEEQAELFGGALYADGERDELPHTAVLASLGSGNPTAMADLHEGETMLDLGSGGGIDVLLSARRVGPSGVAYGLDMTDEMLALVRANQAKAVVENVHWLKGHVEASAGVQASPASLLYPDDSDSTVVVALHVGTGNDRTLSDKPVYSTSPRMSSAVRLVANSSPSSMIPLNSAALRRASAKTFSSIVSRAMSR